MKNELNMMSEGIPLQEVIENGSSKELSLKYSDEYDLNNIEIVNMEDGCL